MDNRIRLAEQGELDHAILTYTRELCTRGPVTAEAMLRYLKTARHLRVTEVEVEDRLLYLEGAKYLEPKKEWEGGEFVHYVITADGQDLLDGVIPPRNWKREK